MAAPLNPNQFGSYKVPEPEHTDYYPVWGEGQPTRIVKGRQAATHKARQRVNAATPLRYR